MVSVATTQLCDCVIRADLDKSTNKKAIKLHFGAFPGGPVVKNLPASGGSMGSIVVLKDSMLQSNQAHAPQLLSPRYRACKLQLLMSACPRAHAP